MPQPKTIKPYTYSTHLFRHVRFCIGRNIYNSRARRQMTLDKLSRLTDISLLKLDHYEIGKSVISVEEILQIACVLKVRMNDLLVV